MVQVALHNRNEFRARIFGTTVKAYAANGTVIASAVLRASRSRYIWTLRPAIRNVSRLEVRTPPNGDCLHFKEVEVFGAREPPVTKPGDAEAAKLIMDQILPNLEDRAIAREGSGGEDGCRRRRRCWSRRRGWCWPVGWALAWPQGWPARARPLRGRGSTLPSQTFTTGRGTLRRACPPVRPRRGRGRYVAGDLHAAHEEAAAEAAVAAAGCAMEVAARRVAPTTNGIGWQ